MSHLQPPLSHLWPLCDLCDPWLWSGKSPRWGWWLGLLSLRYHMWRLCFSPPAAVTSEPCQLFNKLYELPTHRDLVTGFQEFIYYYYYLLLTINEDLSRLKLCWKSEKKNEINSEAFEVILKWLKMVCVITTATFYYGAHFTTCDDSCRSLKIFLHEWPDKPLLICWA